jgi:hypothetical protein
VRTLAGAADGLAGFLNGVAPLGGALFAPQGLAYDALSGLAFIADTGNNAVRWLNVSSGALGLLAGRQPPPTGAQGGYVDAPIGANAAFSAPTRSSHRGVLLWPPCITAPFDLNRIK